jgi:hypothetical protein
MQKGNLSKQLSEQTQAPNLSHHQSLMTMQEAKGCINEIKRHAQKIRELLLDLNERKGWEVLGYKSMRQCMVAEFGKSQSQLYRELKAGIVQKIISPMGEISEQIPERQVRELSKLPESQWLEAWSEAISTAPSSGLTVSHLKKTVNKFQQQNNLERKFQLGDWVEIQSSTKNGFDGKRGAVSLIDEYQIGVILDLEGNKPRIIRFYPNELIKINTDYDEINQELWNGEYLEPNNQVKSSNHPQFQPGDLVWIACPKNADIEQRLLNRHWGIVKKADLTVTVQVKGQTMNYLKSDIKKVKQNSDTLRVIAEKVNKLYQCQDLDELEEELLGFFTTRDEFNEKQLKLLDYIWRQHYRDFTDC